MKNWTKKQLSFLQTKCEMEEEGEWKCEKGGVVTVMYN